MAWLYEKSSTWRRIVASTRGSPLRMAAFGLTCMVAVPLALQTTVQGTSNSERREGELESKLRAQGGQHAKVLARAQRERLQVLLDEIKDRSSSGEERYKAALDGVSLGTHSSGTTAGAEAIKPSSSGGSKGGS